jgi:ketosteroid isomerase-like protein
LIDTDEATMSRYPMSSSIFFAAMLAAACVSAAPTPALTQAQQDEATIRQSLADWVQAFNSGDYAKAAQVWAPDMQGWGEDGEDSYQREMDSARKTPKVGNPQYKYQLRIDEVMVTGDMAVVRDTWTGIGPAGNARSFRSFEVWRRQPDQSWKISRWIDGPSTPDSSVK